MAVNVQNPTAVSDRNGFNESEAGDLFDIVDFERYWMQAVNLRYWIVGIVTTSLIIGLIVTLLQTPLYRSTSRIEVNQIETDLTNVSDLEIDNFTSDRKYFETQYELLKSRNIAKRVVRAGNFSRDEAFRLAFLSGEEELSESKIIEALFSNLSVDPVQKSNLVDIEVSSPDPVLSARVANLWAAEFLASNYDKRFGANAQAKKILEEQISELREKLEISEQELIAYANRNQIVNIAPLAEKDGTATGGQTLVASELSALSAAKADATAERIAAQSALSAGAKDAGSNNAITGQKARLAEVEARLASLRTQYGRSYPEVKALRVEANSLRSSLRGASRDSNASNRARYQSALLQERALQSQFDLSKAAYLSQQGRGVQYGILQREVETNRELYDALLQRIKEIGVIGAGKNNMILIDEAEIASAPFSPSLPKNLLIAMLLGFAISGATVVLRETMDQSIRNPADVKRLLDLPVLGLIPLIPAKELEDQLGDKKSELNEAYQAARTNLSFLTETGAPRTLMFTSTRPDEGKTLTSFSLAGSLGHLGKKVLYLDSDLRNSGLHEVIGNEIKGVPGVSGFLAGNDDFQDSIVSRDKYPFDIYPCGRKPPNPGELLAGPRMKELLDKLGTIYEHIIIDGPPVLGLADALELSSAVDGVAFVVESNNGKVRTIQHALGRLDGAGARIFGALVTKLDERNMGYGYGSGYGYGYGYGGSDIDEE